MITTIVDKIIKDFYEIWWKNGAGAKPRFYYNLALNKRADPQALFLHYYELFLGGFF